MGSFIQTATVLFFSALAGLVLFADVGRAEEAGSSSADEVRALRQRVEELERTVKELLGRLSPPSTGDNRLRELDQKVRILERNRELDQEAAEAKAKTTPVISIGERGFSLSSADTNFSLQIRGLLHVDSRTFFNDAGISGNDGLILRRARPILQGTVFRDFDFMFVPEFGGSGSPTILDAYVNYRYTPALQLRAGKYKVPVGLEQLQSDRDIFLPERALPTDLVPNRDLGFEVHGDLWKGAASYAVGIFNGVGDGRSSSNVDFDDYKEFAGRLFVHPFKNTSIESLRGLGLGVAGTYEDIQRTNSAGLPNNNGFVTPAQQLFFAYRSTAVAGENHWRVSPQAYYYNGPFGLLGEYVISSQGVLVPGSGPTQLANTAWQVAAGYVLTGEDAGFNGVNPRRPFRPRDGQWGAVQLVARYSQLDVDDDAFSAYSNPDTSANSAREWALGLNWYLNRNLKLSTAFSHIDFEGGGGPGSSAPAAVTRADENVLFTRVQLAF